MTTRMGFTIGCVVLVTLAAGCGAAAKPVMRPTAGVGQPSAQHAEAGRLNPTVMGLTHGAKGLERFTLGVDEGGALNKLAVYHHDATRVPAAVRATVEKRFPGASANIYEVEMYADAGLVYQVEVTTADKKVCEVSVLPDGRVYFVECQVPLATLPEAVVETLARAVPDGVVLKAVSKVEPANDELEIHVRVGTLVHSLRMRRSGELVRRTLRVPAVVELPFAGKH